MMPILTITGAGFFGIAFFLVCGVYFAVKVFKGLIKLLSHKTERVTAQASPVLTEKGVYNKNRCLAYKEIDSICNAYSNDRAHEIDLFRSRLCSVLDQYRSFDVTEEYAMTIVRLRNLDLWFDLRSSPKYKAINSIQY